MEPLSFTPAQTADAVADSLVSKLGQSRIKVFVLAVTAGVFVALAAQGMNVAAFGIDQPGLAKFAASAIFGFALMAVVVTGAQLFTGNAMLLISRLQRRAPVRRVLLNWVLVYLGNMAGSLIIVLLVWGSGQWNMDGGALGGYTIKVAVAKSALGFLPAFCSGVLCNILVCAGVWMAASARDITGKLLCCFFAVWLFATGGFEHSVANMYFLPAGLIAACDPRYVQAAVAHDLADSAVAGLNAGGAAVNNLLPATLGNIAGGSVFIGAAFWFCYMREKKKATDI